MTRYRIQGALMLSFIVDDEQQSFLLDTGTLEREGSTVWYINENGRHESITTPNVIEAALDQGLLVEVTPIHEALQQSLDHHVGRVMVSDSTLVMLQAQLTMTFRRLTEMDDIFCSHCPIEPVIFEGAKPGIMCWFLRVTDPTDILWFSIHKEHVDFHFPAECFRDGRPELPVFLFVPSFTCRGFQRTSSRVVEGKEVIVLTIQKEGRRYYVTGNTYSIKDKLRAAGCKWDPNRKAWWTGKEEIATSFVNAAPVSSAAPAKETLGEDERVLGGRGSYKGKTYYMVGRVEHGRTHWDDSVSLVRSSNNKYKLAARDGGFIFWADATLVTTLATYRSLKSIRELREYAEQAAKNRDTHDCNCYCHRERNAGQPGSILYDGCDRCGCEAC